MLRPIAEGQHVFADCNFERTTEEASAVETRLRRKMVLNRKRRPLPGLTLQKRSAVSNLVRYFPPQA